jgi:acyl-ACP thioesterase
MAATAEDRLRAQAHAVGLLNEVEATLVVLGHDREEVAKLTEPLYALCDRDEEGGTDGPA